MSIHINAKVGEIAESILLPGDPLRAKFIAENFLEDVILYNEVRGMLGYTGYYKGKRISVQGTGMGLPSISIYLHELMRDYGVQKLMRIGTCGSINENVKLKDVVLGQASSTDNAMNLLRFDGKSYAPIADFELLKQAYDVAIAKNMQVKVGNVLASDTFYDDDYEKDLEKNLDFLDGLDSDLLLGFYYFFDYEDMLKEKFKNHHEFEDYDEVIMKSKILITSSPQAVLENLASRGRPIYVQREDYTKDFRELFTTLNIPIVDNYDKKLLLEILETIESHNYCQLEKNSDKLKFFLKDKLSL